LHSLARVGARWEVSRHCLGLGLGLGPILSCSHHWLECKNASMYSNNASYIRLLNHARPIKAYLFSLILLLFAIFRQKRNCHFIFISKIRNTYNENMIKLLAYRNSNITVWLLAPVAGHNICHLNRPNVNVI